MGFSDYYEGIEEIEPSCSREENLEKIENAVLVWGRRGQGEAFHKTVYIKEAQDVFSDPKKYDAFSKWYQERQRKGTSPEEDFRKIVHWAARDGTITSSDYQKLLEDAEKIKIPKGKAEDIIHRIADEDGATIGEIEAQPLGVPKLEVGCDNLDSVNHFDFLNVRAGSSVSGSFTINNIGGGILSGSISTNKKWLRVNQNNIDTSRHRQDISFYVDTSGFNFGSKESGIIEIQSNGGTERISIRFSIPQKKITTNMWLLASISILIFIIIFSSFEFDNKNIQETSSPTSVETSIIKKWEFKGVNGDVFDTISCTDGITYIAMMSSIESRGDSNKIYAIDGTSGLKKWEFVLDGGGKGGMGVKPAVANGLVYFGGQMDDKLYALDAETGKKVWEFNGMESMYTSNPAVVDGVVYANGKSGLYALDAYTGERKWHFPTRCSQNSPVIVDDILYIGSSNLFLYAIDAKTGTEIWNIPGASRTFSYPHISNGTLYIETSNYIIKAFDTKTGSFKFEIMMEEEIASMMGAIALSNDILYVTIWKGLNGNGKLYALDALTGSEKWSFDIGAIGIKTPVVGNGIVYVCGWKNRMIYALDATTGVVKCQYQCDNSISTSPIIADGVLYVGVQDKLYAFNVQ